MIIYKKSASVQGFTVEQKAANKNIGFVPTMGALHDGHLSLIKRSKNENDLTICSIYVNPTQFNNKEDFEKYPSTIENDLLLLEEAGCDVVFLPDSEEIYPQDFTKKYYELGALDSILEGAFRQGHYQGVCMVVDRLIQIIPAHMLYLGQKDYQQCMVLKKMITDANLDINITICDTIREENGLAMSSRNKRLTEAERIRAGNIYKALKYIKDHWNLLPAKTLIDNAMQIIKHAFMDIDYLEITDFQLNTINDTIDKQLDAIVLVAVHLNGVRLIDNLILSN